MMVFTPVNTEIQHDSPPWVYGPSENVDYRVLIMALVARHAFDSAVQLAQGNSPAVALAALEDGGPLTLGESPIGLDWQGLLTPSSLPHRLTPYKYSE
jgi:hypothetical protein